MLSQFRIFVKTCAFSRKHKMTAFSVSFASLASIDYMCDGPTNDYVWFLKTKWEIDSSEQNNNNNNNNNAELLEKKAQFQRDQFFRTITRRGFFGFPSLRDTADLQESTKWRNALVHGSSRSDGVFQEGQKMTKQEQEIFLTHLQAEVKKTDRVSKQTEKDRFFKNTAICKHSSLLISSEAERSVLHSCLEEAESKRRRFGLLSSIIPSFILQEGTATTGVPLLLLEEKIRQLRLYIMQHTLKGVSQWFHLGKKEMILPDDVLHETFLEVKKSKQKEEKQKIEKKEKKDVSASAESKNDDDEPSTTLPLKNPKASFDGFSRLKATLEVRDHFRRLNNNNNPETEVIRNSKFIDDFLSRACLYAEMRNGLSITKSRIKKSEKRLQEWNEKMEKKNRSNNSSDTIVEVDDGEKENNNNNNNTTNRAETKEQEEKATEVVKTVENDNKTSSTSPSPYSIFLRGLGMKKKSLMFRDLWDDARIESTDLILKSICARLRRGELVPVVSGTATHSIAFLLSNDFVVVSNRGSGGCGRYGFAVYSFEHDENVSKDSKKNEKEIIPKLSECMNNNNNNNSNNNNHNNNSSSSSSKNDNNKDDDKKAESEQEKRPSSQEQQQQQQAKWLRKVVLGGLQKEDLLIPKKSNSTSAEQQRQQQNESVPPLLPPVLKGLGVSKYDGLVPMRKQLSGNCSYESCAKAILLAGLALSQQNQQKEQQKEEEKETGPCFIHRLHQVTPKYFDLVAAMKFRQLNSYFKNYNFYSSSTETSSSSSNHHLLPLRLPYQTHKQLILDGVLTQLATRPSNICWSDAAHIVKSFEKAQQEQERENEAQTETKVSSSSSPSSSSSSPVENFNLRLLHFAVLSGCDNSTILHNLVNKVHHEQCKKPRTSFEFPHDTIDGLRERPCSSSSSSSSSSSASSPATTSTKKPDSSPFSTKNKRKADWTPQKALHELIEWKKLLFVYGIGASSPPLQDLIRTQQEVSKMFSS